MVPGERIELSLREEHDFEPACRQAGRARKTKYLKTAKENLC